MLWGKQYYYFDLERWLREHKSHPLLEAARHDVRNTEWFHMLNADVISMPDKWEYPWYAAWDLAFHTVCLALVDFDFAKEQLLLMLRSLYFHPSGQIPAYEWNFSDVNPPVHAAATLWLYKYEKQLGRRRPAVPGALVPGADAEFQLVGQSQGPCRAQRLRRRLPGAGQHRHLRPQRAAADRRLAGAGGRDGVDGVLLPEHAGDGDHPDRVRPDLRGDRLQVRPAFHVDRLCDGPPRRASRRDVGRAGRVLLRSAAAARRPGDAVEGQVAGGAAAAVRVDGVRGGFRHSQSEADGADRAVPQAPPRAGFPGGPDRRGFHRLQGPEAAVDPQQAEARARAGLHARRERVPGAARHSFALALSPRASVRVSRRWPGVQGAVPARGIEHAACSAATPTGAVRCGCRSIC